MSRKSCDETADVWDSFNLLHGGMDSTVTYLYSFLLFSSSLPCQTDFASRVEKIPCLVVKTRTTAARVGRKGIVRSCPTGDAVSLSTSSSEVIVKNMMPIVLIQDTLGSGERRLSFPEQTGVDPGKRSAGHMPTTPKCHSVILA